MIAHPAISVIISTWDRPKQVATALHQLATQRFPLPTECLIISDGPDNRIAQLCERAGVRYDHTPVRCGQWGAACKDRGIQLAAGDYLVFWDDDNIYSEYALAALYATAFGYDIGVVQCIHHHFDHKLLPAAWSGQFVRRDIDTMCLCVRREIAALAQWHDGQGRGTDYRYCSKLQHLGARIRFVPIVVGQHT